MFFRGGSARIGQRARSGIAVAILCVFVMGGSVNALPTAITTQPALPLAPLQITAYHTSPDGTELRLLELYNGSKTTLAIRDWRVTDVVNDGRSIAFTHLNGSYIEPGVHVLMAAEYMVDCGGPALCATIAMQPWDRMVTAPKPITSLHVVADGFAPNIATFAAVSDQLKIRRYNTDGYSTATTSTPFVVPYRSLYDDGLYHVPGAPVGLKIIEIYPYSSDCSPFDASILCGDYIKLANDSPYTLQLDDYALRTDSSSAGRTSANTITLSGTLGPGESHVVYLAGSGSKLSLTNSGGYVWLEDRLGYEQYVGTVTRYPSAGSAQQGYSYALAVDGTWQWTSTPQPYGDNIFTTPVADLAPCPDGKYRNPDTGRCRNIEDVIGDLVPCGEGKERSPVTNRCKSIASNAATALTPCKEGYERNPTTNRCRSIASAVAELLPCDEGYERNPATNRCRKAQGTGVLGTEYPVQPYQQGQSAAITWWVVGGVAALALGYAGWEWRREIVTVLAKLRTVIAPGRP